MLTDRTHDPFLADEPDLTADWAMLVMQYLTAAIAVVAALLLAFVR